MLFLKKYTKPPYSPSPPLCELCGLCEKFSSYNPEKRSPPGCEKKCVSRPFRYRSIQARKGLWQVQDAKIIPLHNSTFYTFNSKETMKPGRKTGND